MIECFFASLGGVKGGGRNALRSVLAVVVFSIGFGICHASSARGDNGYRASGFVVYTSAIEGQATNSAQRWDFDWTRISSNQWLLNYSTRLPANLLPVSSRVSIGYDGTNIYSVTYSDQVIQTLPDGEVRVVDAPPSPDMRSPARVSAGPFPIDHSSVVGAIWLSFIGAEFVGVDDDHAVFPNLLVADARRDPLAWACRIDYELEEASPSPLFEVVRFALDAGLVKDKSLQYPELDEPDTPEELGEFKDRIELYSGLDGESLLRTEYLLGDFEMVADYPVPRTFECRILPLQGRDPDGWVGIIQGTIEDVVAVDVSGPLLPVIRGRLDVQDRRVRGKSRTHWRRDVSYDIGADEGWIRDTNHPKIQAELAKPPLPLPGAYSSWSRVAVMLVLVFVGCAAAYALFRKRHLA